MDRPIERCGSVSSPWPMSRSTSLDQSAFPRTGLAPGGGQRRRSIIVAFAGRQDGIGAAFAAAAFGRGTSRAPLSQSRSASQWIAATILKVTSGSAKNDRSSAAVVRARRRPLKVAASRGPSRSVSRMRSLTLSSGRRNPEMIAHRHLDEGRDVKQLVLLLPDAGGADLARLHRQHVGVDVAEGVADLVDDQRQLAVGAIAEIDRQRIEGVAEQPRDSTAAARGRRSGRCRARPRSAARRRAATSRRGRRDRLRGSCRAPRG